LAIQTGELFFLLGPSGCGKTTLLRHIAGFCQPDSGRILFGEKEVTHLPPHQRNTGMVFQSYALWPHMNVAKNVAFGLEERKLPALQVEDRVAEVLAATQMLDYAERNIGELSGGQQQRVALSRALVVRPDCLLLDEPLANLDAKLRIGMRAEIRRICHEFGLTAVYVTHDQAEALSIADRIAIMDAGQILQVGAPQEIYRYPASRQVADFIGESNFIEGSVCGQSAGKTWVATNVGTFLGTTTDITWEPAEGEVAILSIRPESLVLQPWEASMRSEAANTVYGRLAKTTYLGSSAQFELILEYHGAKMIKVQEINPNLSERAMNHWFSAVVSPDDVVVLRT